MILKRREDRNVSIAALERLMAHPDATRHDIQRLRQQIDAIIHGDLSEGKTANELDSHFGTSRNWVVIHDLRIEVDGLAAQIDHLLIGRLLDIWVLESKRLMNGIKVQDNGECFTWRGRVPVAIDSPMEQNRRHVKMLQRLIDAGAVTLPRRLGMTIKPKLHSLALITDGRISRPSTPVPGIDGLIRADQLFSHVDAASEKGNPLDLAKLVSADTLEALGRELVAQHRPIEFDWERRFRLPAQSNKAEPTKQHNRPAKTNVVALHPQPSPPQPPKRAQPAKARSPAGQCEACETAISAGVKRYCQTNTERFSGRILCMDCQPKPTAATA